MPSTHDQGSLLNVYFQVNYNLAPAGRSRKGHLVRWGLLPGSRMTTGAGRTERGFDGLLVGAFESRLAAEMSRLIEAHGGRPMVAPSMREIPLEENREAIDFGEKLLAGQWDVLILLTGVGLKTLVQALETRFPRERILEALGRVTRVCRGPKPVAALRALGLEPGIAV